MCRDEALLSLSFPALAAAESSAAARGAKEELKEQTDHGLVDGEDLMNMPVSLATLDSFKPPPCSPALPSTTPTPTSSWSDQPLSQRKLRFTDVHCVFGLARQIEARIHEEYRQRSSRICCEVVPSDKGLVTLKIPKDTKPAVIKWNCASELVKFQVHTHEGELQA